MLPDSHKGVDFRAGVTGAPQGRGDKFQHVDLSNLDLAIARYMVLAQAIGVIVAATGAWAHLWS